MFGGHSKKSVVVGISGQMLIIRKNVKIQKRRAIQKICGSWNFRPNLIIRKKVELQKRRDFRKVRPNLQNNDNDDSNSSNNHYNNYNEVI